MTTWHMVRRIVAGIVAGLVAVAAQNRGLTLGWAIAAGVSAAIIVGSLFFPLLWKPPRDTPPEGE
jgi:hypothetical protein